MLTLQWYFLPHRPTDGINIFHKKTLVFLDSFYFVDDGFRNSYGRNIHIFEYWSQTLFVDL